MVHFSNILVSSNWWFGLVVGGLVAWWLGGSAEVSEKTLYKNQGKSPNHQSKPPAKGYT